MATYRIDAEAGHIYGERSQGRPIGRPVRGYLAINSRGKHVGSAHRMIWESVHGPIPEGLQINHINGVKADNRIANLELVTPSENAKHAYRLGLSRADGEYNGRAIAKRKAQAQ